MSCMTLLCRHKPGIPFLLAEEKEDMEAEGEEGEED